MEKTQLVRMSTIKHFADGEDPRAERAKKHELGDIIAIAVRAVIRGADNWDDIQTFGNAKIDRFKGFLELPTGIPSRDAFGRVFAMLAPKRFQEPSASWTKEVRQLSRGEVAQSRRGGEKKAGWLRHGLPANHNSTP